jgi:CelD/BcsL family acetyltransferase involved in cellulose biosynthesis
MECSYISIYMSQYNFHLLPVETAITDHLRAWLDLQNRVESSPMATVEWARAYFESYGQSTESKDAVRVLVAIAESQGRIAAVIPLVERTPFGYRYFELLNSSELWEPADMLYDSIEALGALIRHVLQYGIPLILPRHPSDASSRTAIASNVFGALKVLFRSRSSSPRVSIGDNPDHVLNAGRRSDLRRAMKRAEKLGAVSFRVWSPAAEEFSALFATAVEVEAASWKGPNNSALKYDIPARTFYERYGPSAIRAGVLRMAFMYIDNAPVAVQLFCEYSNAVWLLKIGYNAQFSACSPGQLLMMEVIRYASQRKLNRCEFLGQSEAWTKMWTDVDFATENITILPRSWHSLMHLATLAASQVVSRLGRKRATHQKKT